MLRILTLIISITSEHGTDSMFASMFRMKERLMHPRLARLLREYCHRDSSEAPAVKDISSQKLDVVMKEAVENVPFYRALAEAGQIDRKHPRIDQFPVIKKNDIRGREAEFVSDKFDLSSLESTRTSGSTGEPFVFYRGKHEWDDSYACLWRGLFRLGLHMGDNRVFVKGVDERPDVSVLTKVKRWFYNVINRCVVIDAHFLSVTEENVIAAIKRIKRFRPVYLHGYASSIDLLAGVAERKGIRLDDIGVRAVVTESEKLHDYQRKHIERVFSCIVAENYGCVEFGMIAQPDADGNLCINDDHVFVEVGDDGEAVYTNLDAHAFPLIRFKNGDRIELRNMKKSKLPYREIERIEGRVAETIHLPQGGSLQGYIVMYPISKHMKYLREYQVYQPDINHLLIRVVEAEPLPAAIEAQIVSEMRDIVGDIINVEIQKVKSIPLTKRGKRTFVCSDVKQQF